MPQTASQASDDATELDVSGAADQIETLLGDDDEQKDASGANRSSQAEERSEEGASEESSERQGEEEPAQSYTITLDGKDSQVTLDELLKGYQRDADYRNKTMQLAAQRREQAAEFEAVRQERAQYSQLLQQLDQQLSQSYQEPNWDQLRAADPIGYATQWAQHQQLQQRRQAIAAEQARLTQQQILDQQSQLRERVETEAQLLVDAIPAWKDSAKAATERKALVEYGREAGFSAEELNSVYDHRAVKILYKAWKYDQAVAKQRAAQAKVGAAPKSVLQPGQGGVQSRKVADVTRAKQRLAKTGSVDDAAALFERFL